MLRLLTFWLAATPAPDLSHEINRLGDPSWRVREAASAELREMGPAAIPSLRRASRHKDPEIAHRAGLLLDDDLAAFRRQLPDVLPCIDVIDWCHARGGYRHRCPFVQTYLERVGYFTDASVSFPRYRSATWLLVVDLRRQGVPDPALFELVNAMASQEMFLPIAQGGGGQVWQNRTPEP